MGTITGNGTAQRGLGGATGLGETALSAGDDLTYTLDLSAVFEGGFVIAGVSYSATVTLSVDGFLAIGTAPAAGLPSAPQDLTSVFLAPFMADIDTRPDGEGPESGQSWLDIDTAQDVVTITWENVGFYRRNASLTNTVQLQLFDRGQGYFDFVYRYESVNWTSGDLQGGWGGLDGTPAFIGYRFGPSGNATTLPASGVQGAQLALPSSLGNTGQSGIWVFSVNASTAMPAGDGPDTLPGTAGADLQAGLGGNDLLLGSAGPDTLNGGAGYDLVSYSTATAPIRLNLQTALDASGDSLGDVLIDVEAIEGSTFADVMIGNALSNAFYGGAGGDAFYAGGGDDYLVGGAGTDYFLGGAGADYLDGGADYDVASYYNATVGIRLDLTNPANSTGDAAGDVLISIEAIELTGGSDVLIGDAGSNFIIALTGYDALFGGAGSDMLLGQGGLDTLHGGAGDDYLDGGEGVDLASYALAPTGVVANLTTPSANTGDALGDVFVFIENLEGSAFADRLTANAAANAIWGLSGDDTLFGLGGADTLYGGDGADLIEGGAGADMIFGGAGYDLATFANAASGIRFDPLGLDPATADAAGDIFFEIEALEGSVFNDVLYGDAFNNALYGGAGDDYLLGREGSDYLSCGLGNDFLNGGPGGDYLSGGAGYDLITYYTASAAIVIDMLVPSLNMGDAAGDVFEGLEGMELTFGADYIAGDHSPNNFISLAGDDTIYGRGGGDVLQGGPGADQIDGGWEDDLIYGGTGADRFLHSGAVVDGRDIIADYAASEGDVLVFTTANAQRSQFYVTYSMIAGQGSGSISEAVVVFAPTNQALWTVRDGAAMADINISIGGQIFDLLG